MFNCRRALHRPVKRRAHVVLFLSKKTCIAQIYFVFPIGQYRIIQCPIGIRWVFLHQANVPYCFPFIFTFLCHVIPALITHQGWRLRFFSVLWVKLILLLCPGGTCILHPSWTGAVFFSHLERRALLLLSWRSEYHFVRLLKSLEFWYCDHSIK